MQHVCRGCGIDEQILDCMAALCKVVKVIMQAGAGAQVQRELDEAIDEHLRLHIACRGETMWKPKYHYSLHIKMVKGYLLSCFVHERKHRHLKRILLLHQSARAFERSVMEELTAKHLLSIKEVRVLTARDMRHSTNT